MSLRPLIIDTDPGGDDAQAIMLLAASGMFNIRAICAVHGNVGLEYTRRNALYLRDTAGLTCPVCQGASEALLARQPRAAYAHGNNGLSGLEFEVDENKLSRKHPWDVIYDEALHWGGELEIFAVGPLTNIAIALLRHPDLPNYIKQVTIMGGAATKGNSGAYGEFNIVQDPHALKVCLNAGFKKFVMVDLDSCRTAFLTDEEAEYLDNLPLSNPWKPLYDKFAMAQRERRLLMSDEQRMRHTAKPGLSGLAQVRGRNAISWEEKLNLDLKYIENISFINDFKLVFETIKTALIKQEGITDGENATALDYGDVLLKEGKISEQQYDTLRDYAQKLIIENESKTT